MKAGFPFFSSFEPLKPESRSSPTGLALRWLGVAWPWLQALRVVLESATRPTRCVVGTQNGPGWGGWLGWPLPDAVSFRIEES